MSARSDRWVRLAYAWRGGHRTITGNGVLTVAQGAAAGETPRRNRLAARRKALGLTQEQLAERLRVERSTVVRWERGQAQPQPWLRPKLAKALRVSADRIEGLLAVDRAPSGPEHRGAAVPRQLPAAAAGFTGRAAELAALTQTLDRAGGALGTIVITAIGGTPGVGKTTLALHWAHQVAARFPDGQLHVNLRGFDPSGPPVTPAEAIREFLGALGVLPARIPPTPEAQAGLYRSLLADKWMLIVLDNARDEQQVRPLLPASPGSLVLVTSRNQLGGLAAADGARLISLDVLSHAESVDVLTARLGAARAGAEPAAAGEIARLCAYLPLALAVAAARAAARPRLQLAALAAELHDAAGRLDVLDAGDPAASMRTVFSWSYRQLSSEAARMFRLLGIHPGPDISVPAAASLAAIGQTEALRLLRVLARAHLIAEHLPGRYAFHDLLRSYASQLAAEEDGDEGSRRALTRLLDYYLCATASAMDTMLPGESHRRPRPPVSAIPGPLLADPGAARTWLDSERPNLVAAVVLAARQGWPSHATRVAATLYRYLDYGGHYREGMVIHDHARQAAHRAGDEAAEAQSLIYLATAIWRRGSYEQAARHARQAVMLSRQVGDREIQARALDISGTVSFHQGSLEKAAKHFEQAVALFRAIGEPNGQAGAIGNLAGIFMRQGRYEQAAANLRQALVLFGEMGNRAAEGSSLNNLGIVEELQGHYEEAASYHAQALDLFRETGYRGSEAHALNYLGIIEQRRGRYDPALRRHQQALAMFQDVGDRAGEGAALNGLAEAYLATGQFEDACAHHAAALDLASQVGKKEEQARAHRGLGRVHSATGDTALAHQHWQEALSIYTELGLPEADEVRAQLATKGAKTSPR